MFAGLKFADLGAARNSGRVRRMAVLAVLALAAGGGGDAGAKADLACGSVHVIARGDTLSNLADRAYGASWKFGEIYRANNDRLASAATLEVGDEILIPCLDGTGPQSRREAVALGLIVEEPAAQAVSSAAEPSLTIEADDDPDGNIPVYANLVELIARPTGTIAPAEIGPRILRFVTSSAASPYVDPNRAEGGLLPELVGAAVAAADPELSVRVAYVNDWHSHLDVLLPDGAFDVSFPWLRPDCSKTDDLAATARKLCAEYDFSDPFLEVPVAYYALAGTPAATGDAGIPGGLRICLPGEPLPLDSGDRATAGPEARVSSAATARDCLARLMRGEADLVALGMQVARAEIAQAGPPGTIVEVAGLRTSKKLHAVARKSDPAGIADLELLNRGLAALMASGEWFEIVAAQQRLWLASSN